ncbi:hypothetical protein Xmau_01376 [Xenorhabdus mauleonii]|uniref:Uncharacterized protein n=1 Tax=Xenorhabdus mauleonii TaxID=351675 RepID=A0A1I3KVD5_9GAMM|nr:hypothetical protein Xmau_01376 [Xenorhabdus mauleonii]SFI76489.1 hypothetical protein SAMN05421680_103205 [Xenorhabdus mauleonii]
MAAKIEVRLRFTRFSVVFVYFNGKLYFFSDQAHGFLKRILLSSVTLRRYFLQPVNFIENLDLTVFLGLTEHNEEKNTFHNIANHLPDRDGGAFSL